MCHLDRCDQASWGQFPEHILTCSQTHTRLHTDSHTSAHILSCTDSHKACAHSMSLTDTHTHARVPSIRKHCSGRQEDGPGPLTRPGPDPSRPSSALLPAPPVCGRDGRRDGRREDCKEPVTGLSSSQSQPFIPARVLQASP